MEHNYGWTITHPRSIASEQWICKKRTQLNQISDHWVMQIESYTILTCKRDSCNLYRLHAFLCCFIKWYIWCISILKQARVRQNAWLKSKVSNERLISKGGSSREEPLQWSLMIMEKNSIKLMSYYKWGFFSSVVPQISI